jgi:hypothetical protein
VRIIGALAGVAGPLEFLAAPTGVRSLRKPRGAHAGVAALSEFRGTIVLASTPTGFCHTLVPLLLSAKL